MKVPIVSHETAMASIEAARKITQTFCKDKGLSYDEWENSAPKGSGYRTLRLRLKIWENFPTPDVVTEWMELITPVLAPGFKHYTSDYVVGNSWGTRLKGNAVKYHYKPDGKKWWVREPYQDPDPVDWSKIVRLSGKPHSIKGRIQVLSLYREFERKYTAFWIRDRGDKEGEEIGMKNWASLVHLFCKNFITDPKWLVDPESWVTPVFASQMAHELGVPIQGKVQHHV
jgi:hypothetical protein